MRSALLPTVLVHAGAALRLFRLRLQPLRFAGIDVGARHLHCVAIARAGAVSEVLVAGSPAEAVAWAAGAAQVAVDAPDRLSTAPHAADATLSPKFREARCAEIALGREAGIWVPWTTPARPPVPPWMESGFAVFAGLRAEGAEPLEVYPAGAFWLRSNRRWPPSKSSAAGRLARVALLRELGVTGPIEGWSHHALDALMAAAVARERAADRAVAAGCGHDGSAIWMPPGGLLPPASGLPSAC